MSRFLKICTVLFTLYASSSSFAVHQLSKRENIITPDQSINCDGHFYSGQNAWEAARAAANNLKNKPNNPYPYIERWQGGQAYMYPLQNKVFTGDRFTGPDFVVLNQDMQPIAAVHYTRDQEMSICLVVIAVPSEYGEPNYERDPNNSWDQADNQID